MQPFPHHSDATHKIWSRLANWHQRHSSSKVWTTYDSDRPLYAISLPCEPLAQVSWKGQLAILKCPDENQHWQKNLVSVLPTRTWKCLTHFRFGHHYCPNFEKWDSFTLSSFFDSIYFCQFSIRLAAKSEYLWCRILQICTAQLMSDIFNFASVIAAALKTMKSIQISRVNMSKT